MILTQIVDQKFVITDMNQGTLSIKGPESGRGKWIECFEANNSGSSWLKNFVSSPSNRW